MFSSSPLAFIGSLYPVLRKDNNGVPPPNFNLRGSPINLVVVNIETSQIVAETGHGPFKQSSRVLGVPAAIESLCDLTLQPDGSNAIRCAFPDKLIPTGAYLPITDFTIPASKSTHRRIRTTDPDFILLRGAGSLDLTDPDNITRLKKAISRFTDPL